MAGGGGVDGRSPRIDLVPIIDAMTCVIFFLLLSSTFVEFTKITMPPAVTKVAAASVAKDPPLAPQLTGIIKDRQIVMLLSWNGKNPDFAFKKIRRDPKNQRSEALQGATQALVADFRKKFPNETALQLGFSAQATYQEMISVMDGARKEIQDLVMVSWVDAQAVESRWASNLEKGGVSQ